MRIAQAGVRIGMRGEDPLAAASRVMNTLLYTALAESSPSLRQRRFVGLLSILIEEQWADLAVVCHVGPFVGRFQELATLLVEHQDLALDARVASTSSIVHRTTTSLLPGLSVPHTIAFSDNIFSIEPTRYHISLPGASTSDLLIALAAMQNGQVLCLEHVGELGYRDKLLLEYLDRAKLGEPFSFDDFRAREEDPELWYMAPKDSQ